MPGTGQGWNDRGSGRREPAARGARASTRAGALRARRLRRHRRPDAAQAGALADGARQGRAVAAGLLGGRLRAVAPGATPSSSRSSRRACSGFGGRRGRGADVRGGLADSFWFHQSTTSSEAPRGLRSRCATARGDRRACAGAGQSRLLSGDAAERDRRRAAGLGDAGRRGWTRIIVEKPFGRDSPRRTR